MLEYIRALKGESTAERRISRMSVDILVQVHFLDKLLEGNLAIQPEWLHWRDTCISFVDKLVDKDEAFVQDYGNIYKVDNVEFNFRCSQKNSFSFGY